MFGRWKKDKDKGDDKKKKVKKEKAPVNPARLAKPSAEKEPLSQEELKRLDELQRSFGKHGHEEDGFEKQSNSSDYSLSSAADSSPSGGSLSHIDSNKPGSPTKRPPPLPQKPVLRVKPHQAQSNLQTMPSPQGSTYSMMSLHLGTNNLTNEMIEIMEQMNQDGGCKNLAASLSPVKPSVPPAPPSQVPPGEQGGYGVRWKSYALDLRLPPITCIKPPKIRTLTIQRQPTGDFGFSLRRAAIVDRHSMQGESKQTIIFAEPSSTGSTNDTGLFIGDRLLEVNGMSVENRTRDEIIKLIKPSNDSVSSSVVLKVQPVMELRELNSRCCFDDADHGGEQNTQMGTLSRSGSRRSKTVAKSEEQVESEKTWLQSEKVWVVHKGGFSSARLVKSGPKPPEGKVRVKLEFTGDELEVDEEDVEKVNPPQFDYVENLSQLRHVSESSLLHVLRQRFCSQLMYTYAGSNLLVLNPVHPLAAYSEKVMRMFKGCKENDMPPHIYAAAQSGLNSLLRTRRDQSVILLGRSGSGKTVNFRHILQYFVTIAGASKQVLTSEKLNAVITVLEAFGNCRTVLNANATRFTELFTLDCDHSGQIVSSSVQVYMFEKTRVCRRPEGEPNFHIFYQFLAGVDDTMRKELFLEDLQEPNLFMTPLHKEEDKKRASISWSFINAAMQTLSIQQAELKAIWSILAAIYHLGVASACKGTSGRLQFLKPQSAQKAASLLGTSVEELAKCIFSSEQNGPVSGKVSPRSGEVVVEASECLQSIVMGLYNEVFNALVFLINRALSGSGRSMASIHVLDTPGFQNPATCGRIMGASFEDLCQNYCQERFQLLYHETTFLNQQERYTQENIDWNKEAFHIPSPAPLVSVMDHAPQQGPVRASSTDLREVGRRGLLWLLDEESLFPGATEKSFLDKVFTHYSGKDYQQLVRKGPYNHQFTVQHFQGTNPVVYSITGWVRSSREHPVFKQAALLLQDSQRECINQLFALTRGMASTAAGGGILTSEGSSTLRRSSSMRRAQSVAASGVKRRSLPLQVKYTMDGLTDMLKRTNLHFIHCFLPQHNAAVSESRSAKNSDEILNIPLLRSQIRGAQILDMVRIHKQGFPENLMYSEFRRRFEILALPDYRVPSSIYDERQAVEGLLEHIDIEKSSYRLGLSQIFFRPGTLGQLEVKRDEKLNDCVVSFQAQCRGWLARSGVNRRKVQELAIRCIQRNVRRFLAIRSWSWWRLYVKVLPLLNVHRTEEELRHKTEELEALRSKLEKIEKDRSELKQVNEKLEAKVSELWSDLTQEQSSAAHTSEILEAETTERMRLEKEVQDLQSRFSHVQQKSDKMEMEMMEARVYRSSGVNGDLSDGEEVDGDGSIYKQKYERAVRDMEIMKRRIQQQHEEEVEQNLLNKKAADKKLAEALEDVEEERQVANQWKRKAQKLSSELQDIRLMLEEQMSRNGELEKKQRRFDSELNASQEEIKKERLLREKLVRERDQVLQEKYSLEQELHSTRLDMDMQHEKITQLNRELDELSLSSKGEEEVTQLKRAKQELERKTRDQEEELEELAGQVQMLEQAKLRLEMSLEKLRQEHRRESSVREEEIEELRASFSKKIKNLEAQLETEQEDRHQLVKQKHELERRLIELTDQPPPQDPEIERRLRRDLKRTKALLRDAQSMLEHVRDGQGNKSIIRQLKNQLEDAEFAKCAAIKAKQTSEMELHDLQLQFEEVSRTKNDAESRCLQLSREKSAIQTQLEEMEEELSEVMKKYKAAVAQMSIDQKTISEQTQQITELEVERHALKEQLSEVNTKFEHLAGQSEDAMKVHRLDSKVRELESKLELEQTTRGRLEHQITRLKEQIERLQEECDGLRNKESQAQEGIRRFQRQIRELREDYAALQQKEADAYRKQHELETALENAESDLKVTKNDLRLACQRIEELKNALEDDLDSGTDVPDDSGSDSDSSLDMSVLRHSLTPIQRCDSASSDLSFGGRRSTTPSMGYEFSAMCSRGDAQTEVNGFSHIEESKLSPGSSCGQENLDV